MNIVLFMHMSDTFQNLPEEENNFSFASARGRFVAIVSNAVPMQVSPKSTVEEFSNIASTSSQSPDDNIKLNKLFCAKAKNSQF